MPRDISGNYTLPAGNPVVTGTTISSTWANSTLSDIAAALTASLSIDGSVTNAKLATNSVSNVKIQDDAVTPPKLDGLTGSGLVVASGSAFVAARTLTGPAAGLTVTNGDGVAGNPTIALANDLSAIEALGATGLAVRTAADTWAQRTITGTANKITVTNGDGVAGNPTLTLPDAVTLVTPTVTGAATFQSTIDATGNISSDGYLEGDHVQTASGDVISLTAWVTLDMTGTLTILDSYNVSSLTDTATGRFRVNFAANMANSNYASSGCLASAAPLALTLQGTYPAGATDKTVTGVTFDVRDGSDVLADATEVSVIFAGGLL